MNRYEVTINNHPPQEARASRASVAVHRAMDRWIDGEFKPAGQIKVRFLGKVEYEFDVVADTTFVYDNGVKGTQRQTILTGYPEESQAQAEAERLRVAHPDWKFVRTVKRAIK